VAKLSRTLVRSLSQKEVRMTKRRVTLNYTVELLSEPIIYTISQQFNLATNIIRADITEERGWIILELEGRDEDIEAGITWAISKGMRVELTSEEPPPQTQPS
jgi:ABC-type methionine transport system ATPase subunit